MFNKIRKVLTVYLSNWSIRIVLLVMISLFVIVPSILEYGVFFYDSTIPSTPFVKITILERGIQAPLHGAEDEHETSELRNKFALEQIDRNAGGIEIERFAYNKNIWQVLQKMPNLTYLDLRSVGVVSKAIFSEENYELRVKMKSMPEQDFENLGRLSGLETLRLPLYHTTKAKFLTPLVELKKLKWLDLSNSINGFVKQIPVLDQLETLHLPSIDDLQDSEVITHLQNFSNLKTIIVDFPYRDYPDNQWSDLRNREALISNVTSLNQVCKFYLPRKFILENNSIANALPHREIYSTSVLSPRITFLIIIIWVTMLISLIIGNLLWNQFSRPEALMIPNYNTPHIVVPTILFLFVLSSSTFFIWMCDTNLYSSFSLSTMAASVVWNMAYPGTSKLVRWFIISLPISMFLFALAHVFFFPQSTIIIAFLDFLNRFLEGSLPIVTIGISFMGCAFLGTALYSMRTIHHKLLETGYSVPIMSMSDLQRIQNYADNSEKHSRFRFLFERLLHPNQFDFKKYSSNRPQNFKQTRSKFWNLPGRFSSRRILMLGVSLILLGEIAWFIFIAFQEDSLRDSNRNLYFNLWVITFGLSYFLIPLACAGWWQRVPMMAHELMFPRSRSEFVYNLYAGVFRDVIWFPILFVTSISPVMFFFRSLEESLVWIGIYLATCFGITLLHYGIALWFLQFRQTWQLLVLEMLSLCGFIASMLFVFQEFRILHLSETDLLWSLCNFALGLFLTGTLVSLLAMYRWSKLEFAKLV